MTHLQCIGQIARSVGNVEASTVFFRDTLGLAHLYSFPGLAFFDCDGLRLYLQQSEGAPGPESILHFRVPDIEAAHADLSARGVSFTHPPRLIHRHDDGLEEWMAFFADPDGRPLALMAQKR